MKKVKPTSRNIVSVVIFVIIIVTVDYLFLRHLFWERLFVNILIFVVYLVIFLKVINKWSAKHKSSLINFTLRCRLLQISAENAHFLQLFFLNNGPFVYMSFVAVWTIPVFVVTVFHFDYICNAFIITFITYR